VSEFPVPDAPRSAQRFALRFDGEAREYFRIWIVNLFLSVVTLGLYSPWAKVRKKRYLYGNTWLAGANFDYHGNPVAILKGRLIAVAAFLAYTFASELLPNIEVAVSLVLVAAAPWLLVRTLQFNAVNSSYRNLRFHFDGRYPEALAAIIPLALSPLVAFAIGTDTSTAPVTGADWWLLFVPFLAFAAVYPYVVGSLKRFHLNHTAFGNARFGVTLSIGAFYGIYAVAGLIAVTGFMGLGFIAGVFLIRIFADLGAVMSQVLFFVVMAAFLAYSRARIANLVFNAARMQGGVRFVSTLSATALTKLYFGNLVAIAFSGGLLVPWAVVRTARYRASCLAVECEGDPDSVLAGVARPVGAAGDELGEVFDVDVSL
jgi:uncharacterized membrane protein YjgN (DUF898 family)